MVDLSPVPLPGRRMFRVTEAAAHLGVSPATVCRELAAGRLPSVRIRTRRLIPEYALDRWIEAQIAGPQPGDATVSRPTPPGPAVAAVRPPGAGAFLLSPVPPGDAPELDGRAS